MHRYQINSKNQVDPKVSESQVCISIKNASYLRLLMKKERKKKGLSTILAWES